MPAKRPPFGYRIAMILLLIAAAGALGIYATWFRGGQQENRLTFFNAGYHRLGGEIEPDPEISAFVAPFAADLAASMNRQLTVSGGLIPIGQPESPLGNLTADLLRSQVHPELGREVDIAILNRGGLRIALPEGEISVGTLFELIPFENLIVLLRFDGAQILRIADEVAVEGGEPISGLRMSIRNGRAENVTVAGEPVDPARMYWVSTNNWLADGGGPVPTLWEPQERFDTDVLLRDVFTRILEQREFIEPLTDGRIRAAP